MRWLSYKRSEMLIMTQMSSACKWRRFSMVLICHWQHHPLQRALAVNGEEDGWSFIRQFNRANNGHAAFLALKLQAEGQSVKLTRKTKAHGGKNRYFLVRVHCHHQFRQDQVQFQCHPAECSICLDFSGDSLLFLCLKFSPIVAIVKKKSGSPSLLRTQTRCET